MQPRQMLSMRRLLTSWHCRKHLLSSYRTQQGSSNMPSVLLSVKTFPGVEVCSW